MTIDEALKFACNQALCCAHETPTLGTLMDNVGELARAMDGNHPDPPVLELIHIAGIALNLLRPYSADEAIAALLVRYGIGAIK